MSAEAWNLLDILVLVVVIAYNTLYYFTHANGKKTLRLWAAGVLTLALLFRLLLATGHIDQAGYSALIRPWVGLIYLLPAMDAYVDWKKKK